MRGLPRPRTAVLLAAAAGAVLSSGLVAWAFHANGFFGFPLDDAWIHLTFARTLATTGRFAYFPGDPLHAGSTSPLYTLLLAAGWRLVGNEFLLSYALGLAAQATFLVLLGRWAAEKVGARAAAAVVLLVAFDPRIALLAVSGMETSLFLATIAGAFAARAAGRPTLAAVAVGAAVWVRPDGLVLAGVLAIDAALGRLWDRERGPTRLARPAIVLASLLALYALFNVVVGGRVLPDTFAAKTAFYAVASRAGFLRRDVAGLVTTGGWIVLAPFVAGGLLGEIVALARRRASPRRAEAGFAVALPLAYLALLPFGHRFDRYLVPALPAIAVVGVGAARDAIRWAAAERGVGLRAALAGALVLAVGVPQVVAATGAASTYAGNCRYHEDRHVRCGRWLAAHTPEGAVIATHDIGAIGFYSGRRIVDAVGLIDPEVVAHLNAPDYTRYLSGLFTARGVTYLAVLRNWLEVSNVAPVFVADPRPEILEVYPWIPGRTHLVPKEASRLEQEAAAALVRGDDAAALAAVTRAVGADPECARIRLLEAKTYAAMRRLPEAEAAYRRALELQPGSPDARFGLATVLAATGRRDEARAIAERLRAERVALPKLDAFYRALGGR